MYVNNRKEQCPDSVIAFSFLLFLRVVSFIMDSLLENLENSFKVDDRPNNTDAAHPYFMNFYKCRNDASNQAARRKQFLEAQKKKRTSEHNTFRNILETDSQHNTTKNNLPKEKCQSMEWLPSGKKKIPFKSKTQDSECLKNILMESEWLVDVPDDLDTRWTAVVCPQGKRCILVAKGNGTQAYDKAGRQFMSFPSWLPSGSWAETYSSPGGHKNGQTILDCIYNFDSTSFYVLDVIEWNSHPFLSCETDFRFYWLSSKFDEIIQLSEKSKNNPKSIHLAPRFPAAELPSRMAHFPLVEETNPKVDGILFYHNETHYTSGSTPLVGWLKPFMVPEMLKISVHEAYKADVPPNYLSAVQFIQSSLSNQAQKTKHRTRKDSNQKGIRRGKNRHSSSIDKVESMEEDSASNQDPPVEATSCDTKADLVNRDMISELASCESSSSSTEMHMEDNAGNS